MDVKDLGRVVPIFRGNYDSDYPYEPLDLVYFQEATYVALTNVKGVEPDMDAQKWQLVVRGVISETQMDEIVEEIMHEIESAGYVMDEDYVHTDNNFTDTYKEILDNYQPTGEFTGLCLEATSGDFIFTMTANGMRYSLDGEEWLTMPYGFMINITEGNTIRLLAASLQPVDLKPSIIPSSSDNVITASGIVDSIHFPGYQYSCALRNREYKDLFRGLECRLDINNLTLPATTLADSCYYEMFAFTNLNGSILPALPATILADECYKGMFMACGNIDISNIDFSNVTTLKRACFYEIFGSSQFTEPDLSEFELPCVEVPDSAYARMFMYTNITKPPIIRGEYFNNGACEFMFYECYYLTEVPEMTIRSAESGTFQYMFSSCPILDASDITIVANIIKSECFTNMFAYCHSLVTAPILPSKYVAPGAYNNMFYECQNLNYLECLMIGYFQSGETTISFEGMMYGVADSGTFVKASGVDWVTDSDAGVPTNWTETSEAVIDSQDYFTMTCHDDDVQISFEWEQWWGGSINSYRINEGSWVTIPENERIYLDLHDGDSIQFKCTSVCRYYQFTMEGNGTITLHGDFDTLWNPDCRNMNMGNFSSIARNVFYECVNITDASDMVLRCWGDELYENMFSGCSSLEYPPVFAGNVIGNACFRSMFQSCGNLKEVMDLSNVTGYQGNDVFMNYMYHGCGSITDITNAIPINCPSYQNFNYEHMFEETGVTAVPDDFFTGVETFKNIHYMFYNCNNLAYVKDMEMNRIRHESWLYGVSGSGTFVMNPNNIISPAIMRGESSIPNDWTVEYASDEE